MHVQMLESMRGPGVNLNSGDIVEVDAETGERMIAKAIAIEVTPEPAASPRRRTRRKKATAEKEQL